MSDNRNLYNPIHKQYNKKDKDFIIILILCITIFPLFVVFIAFFNSQSKQKVDTPVVDDNVEAVNYTEKYLKAFNEEQIKQTFNVGRTKKTSREFAMEGLRGTYEGTFFEIFDSNDNVNTLWVYYNSNNRIVSVLFYGNANSIINNKVETETYIKVVQYFSSGEQELVELARGYYNSDIPHRLVRSRNVIISMSNGLYIYWLD